MWQVISRGLSIDVTAPEFLDIIAAARRRISRLEHFILAVDDREIAPDIKRHVTEALQRGANALNPAQWQQGWTHATNVWLQQSDATTLRMFSPTMMRYRPLRKLGDEEREEALLAINAAISEIQSSVEFDKWERLALLEGYERLALVIRHFPFFGHEGVGEENSKTHQLTVTITGERPSTRGALTSAFHALNLVAKIVEIVAVPSVTYQAFNDYQKYWTLASAPPAVLRLAAPTAAASAVGGILDKALPGPEKAAEK